MDFHDCFSAIKEDCYRYKKRHSKPSIAILKQLLRDNCFRFNFWFRLGRYCKSQPFLRITLYPFVRMMYKHYSYKFGFAIPTGANIDKGLYLPHFSNIIISDHATIGSNATIMDGVTIGVSKGGAPAIGDNVYIGAGAKLIGPIHIGDNVAIGANAVVVSNVEKNCTVGGIPAKIISTKGSQGLIPNSMN